MGLFRSIFHTAVSAVFCVAFVNVHYILRIKKLLTESRPVDSVIDAKKKVIVISGCDHGFGYLLVEALLKNSDFLVLALVLTEKGIQDLKSLGGDSEKLFTVRCDVTSDEDIKKAGEMAKKILSEEEAVLFGVVNNAGILSAGEFLFYQGTIEEFRKTMDVNFFGQLRLTQAMLPMMLKTSRQLSNQPRIINLSSMSGTAAFPAISPYCASKYAVEGWSDSLRVELAPFSVKVVKMRPGGMGTKIVDGWIPSFFENFTKASAFVKNLYGGDAYVEFAEGWLQGKGFDSASLSPPSLVTTALMNALSLPDSKLKPHYFVGDDANTLGPAFAFIPTPVRDTILSCFYPPPLVGRTAESLKEIEGKKQA